MYRIGFDIGIGSIGWAVIMKRGGENPYIEDFGVRIFDPGEQNNGKDTSCRTRRSFRSVRRLERRRQYRKVLLKNHWSVIGMVNPAFEDDMSDCKDSDIYTLKVTGLDHKLTSAELFRCLIHTCNHRGYRDFYDLGEDSEILIADDSENNDEGKNKQAVSAFTEAYRASGCRIVSEYLIKESFNGSFVNYRNRKGLERYTLIDRDLMRAEVFALLEAQSRYYPQLTKQNIQATADIIFNQRDFEDGPGDKNDPTRRYHGFLETLGACPFYKDEKRGFRSTVLSDVYAVTNTLSQYRFIDTQTGEFVLGREAAQEIITFLLIHAEISHTQIQSILKKYGCKMQTAANADTAALGKSIRFLKIAKRCVEKAGLCWEDVIGEYTSGRGFDSALYYETTDGNTADRSLPILHTIGEALSKYQTPRRREAEMKKLGISSDLIAACMAQKTGGTAAVSYRYMCDSINAFLNGDIYGNFQAGFICESEKESPTERFVKLPPSCIDDPDMKNNRVVFKSINETRKILNAIIERYGSPDEIIVEVADELGTGYFSRMDTMKYQRERQKTKDNNRHSIAELLGIPDDQVTGDMLDRYALYQEQEGKSMYSGEPLGDLTNVLQDTSKRYEVDHIVPFSVILDNTLNNKALVFAIENQNKGQRTPLMYISGDKRKTYTAAVKEMYTRKKGAINKKKYQYMMLDSLSSPEARELLDEWKSRNINDTRYITKYIVGILKKHLIFADNDRSKTERVFAVKGAVTSKFRREWFRDSEWGTEEKNRDTYLNHALDAVVIANLTRPYIEIGSDAIRLRTLWKKNGKKISDKYSDYLERCIRKMEKYYGFRPEYSRSLLTKTGRTPSYVPKLEAEVKVRFNDYGGDQARFEQQIQAFYPSTRFVRQPHMPIASMKQNNKFQGTIADSNHLKIVEIDGETYKISRVPIQDVKADHLAKIYTGDSSLVAALNKILVEGDHASDSKYTVGAYMKEHGLTCFRTEAGQPVRMISVMDKHSNFYRIDKSETNYYNLGMLKYYCVEVYRTKDGKSSIRGVRYVDMVHKNGKLWMKPESVPEDYAGHIMYLQKNEYIIIRDKKGQIKAEGFYQSVKAMTRKRVNVSEVNKSGDKAVHDFSIAANDSVEKYDISILGEKAGLIKCSEPYPLLKATN